jgi:glycosyltransferase involved in cell wall biosynthesis
MVRKIRQPLCPPPLVSIGIAVRNGENYVERAITSVLEQTYDNLEIIVSDNASTDRTFEICREIAALDSRLSVYRNKTNLGAALNFNRVSYLARGKYFKWLAHDDLIAPRFVESAVGVLESEPRIVLCHTKTHRINDSGQITGQYISGRMWDSSSVSARFRSLVFTRHPCVAVFGLIRKADLFRTPLIAPYVGSDRVLMAELGLRGRLFEIPEYLMFRRDHPGTSLRSFPDPRFRVVWFDPSKSPRFAFPEWNEAFGYGRAIMRVPLEARERWKCLLVVTAWMRSRWRPLLADFKYAVMGVDQVQRPGRLNRRGDATAPSVGEPLQHVNSE